MARQLVEKEVPLLILLNHLLVVPFILIKVAAPLLRNVGFTVEIAFLLLYLEWRKTMDLLANNVMKIANKLPTTELLV
ncbi:Uncharacterized protein TCM_031336 [Theobroma cacao]|uniref:Uncharacterized protein n=1 Tax=Theobroma cacao TaxID=3641 RepID=A0A061F642_THECC|nr:Uncharacterized protein TCM_031336 [Theobroma cacao]